MTSRAQTTFSKGHGTGNDFVLIADPRGELDLTPEQVAAWCDRHRGIGGDGLIRAIRSESLPEGRAILAEDPAAEWFMDYRNGDGSIAEMCGNGVRVFVHFLRSEGLAELETGQQLRIGTRAGVKTVVRVDPAAVEPGAAAASAAQGPEIGQADYYAVDLGPWRLQDAEAADRQGSDALVLADGLDMARPALSVSMGNPHTVVALAHDDELETLSLHREPEVEPRPLHGTNVEFVVPQEPGQVDGVGELRMRVFERGVGETQSCGTGAAAVAAASMFWGGDMAPKTWLVAVPGGRVRVSFQKDAEGLEHAILAGPAVIVAQGTAAL